jgi:hypothetical protein
MKQFSQSEFKQFCDISNIDLPDSNLDIGRDLFFKDIIHRTIVLHISKSDQHVYLFDLISSILSLDSSWILVPRYQYKKDFKLFNTQYTNEFLTFDRADIKDICEYLIRYLDKLCVVSDDLYLVSQSGDVIVRYDHHIYVSGLTIYINNIIKSNKLLIGLNTLGAELELYFED